MRPLHSELCCLIVDLSQRVEYKLGVMLYECRSGQGSKVAYVADFCLSVSDVVSQQSLRSASRRLLVSRHRLSMYGVEPFRLPVQLSRPELCRAKCVIRQSVSNVCASKMVAKYRLFLSLTQNDNFKPATSIFIHSACHNRL